MKILSLIIINIVCLFTLLSCKEYFSSGELIPASDPYVKDAGVYLEFIAYGDAGKGSTEQQLTADEMSYYTSNSGDYIDNSIDFIINLGDSFYEEGVTSTTDPLWNTRFEDIYDAVTLNMPFYCILGNHDYRGNIDAQIDYVSPNNDRWQMPDRYYSKTFTLSDTEDTQIDFFFLDTEQIFYGDAEQLVWLDESLSSSTAQWKIVLGHRPLYSYGYHGMNGTLIPRLQPILNNNADLYMSGHEHDIQILGPLYDVYHIVNGSAGASWTTVVGVGDLTIFAAGRTGFMGFLISNDELVCRVIETGSGVIYTQILKSK